VPLLCINDAYFKCNLINTDSSVVPHTLIDPLLNLNTYYSRWPSRTRVFATLAKVGLSTESTKVSNLVAVSHTTDQLSRLWLYPWRGGGVMSNKRNLLYKPWTAGLSIWRRRKLLRKKKERKKTYKKCIYMYSLTQTRTVTFYKIDPSPVREYAPRQTKPQLSWLLQKSRHESGTGSMPRRADWLTDWLTDWLAGWLADWMIDWLTDWLTDCMTDWLADWLTAWLIGWVTDWLIDWLIGWLDDWLIDYLTDCLADWPTDWLTGWLTPTLRTHTINTRPPSFESFNPFVNFPLPHTVIAILNWYSLPVSRVFTPSDHRTLLSCFLRMDQPS